MHRNGKQPIKQEELVPSQLILPIESDLLAGDQERDEDSDSGMHDVVTGTPEFLEIANEEKGPRVTAPADAIEVLDVEPPVVKDVRGDRKLRTKGTKGSATAQRKVTRAGAHPQPAKKLAGRLRAGIKKQTRP
jgi:hypothetical protein